MNCFEVAKFPKYRRVGALRSDAAAIRKDDTLDSDDWKRLFAADVRSLVSEVLTHRCGDSCFKYSGKNIE